MTVGVLAFHGDFAEHVEILRNLNMKAKEVRNLEDLASVHRLIIPGGESTVMSRFLFSTGVGEEIQRRVQKESFPVYGTCAGAILLAKEVFSDGVPESRFRPLGLMDISVERNAYGRQTESFEEVISLHFGAATEDCPAIFIRAPKVLSIGQEVEVLARHHELPIAMRQGNLLASTFHPELRNTPSLLHRHFLTLVSRG